MSSDIKSQYDILILDEIRDFISPLSDEEVHLLEKSIQEEGCKDPLIVWQRNGDSVLVDGHHRFEICKKHNLDFQVKKIHFDSMDQAQIWMVNNQMGRRNLTSDQMSYYRGKKYLLLKKSHGGFDFVERKGSSDEPTSIRLSKEFKVGESTIRRDAKFAEGLELISKSNPELKNTILKGESSLKKGDIQILSEFDEKTKRNLKVKNEADLYNKIVQFRKNNIDAIEQKLAEIESTKYAEAQAELQAKDSMFLNQNERLERLKARIISAINDAIRNKNINAIEELKVLIDRLQKELFYDE